MTEISSYKLACVIARILDDKKAQNITILDISKVSVLADYFVIVSAQTSSQVKSLTNNTREKIKELFSRIPVGDENDLKNRWNLLDYGDVVLHVMQQDERDNYALEKFWSHAYTVKEDDWLENSKEYAMYLNA